MFGPPTSPSASARRRRRELPADRPRRRGGHRYRRRGGPSGLRLPGRAGRVRAGRRGRGVRRSSGRAGRRSPRLATSLPRAAARSRPACRSSRERFDPAPVDRADQVEGDPAPRPRRSASRCMVKAAAGGGGRGMRRVETAAELPAALVAGSREAAAAFGDGSVYLEREVRPARHIEVQLLGRPRRPHRRDRRAGLLAPAPPPEARRGVAGAWPVAEQRGPCPRPGGPGRVGGRPDERRDGGVPARPGRRLLVPRGQCPAPGRAWRDRAGDRPRPRPGAVLARGRPPALGRGSWPPPSHGRRRRRVMRSRSGSRPRIRPGPSPRRPAGSGRWRMPSGPGVRVDTAIEAGERVPPDYDP